MSYDPTIKAKPTYYRKILFKSRLEARWAIFLDHYPCIKQWEYEPGEIVLTDNQGVEVVRYTPDFILKYENSMQFVLEVKPLEPNKEYLEMLNQISRFTSWPVLLGYGSMFCKSGQIIEVPNILSIYNDGQTQNDPMLTCPWFHACREYYEFACRFRLDLDSNDYRPPRQRGDYKLFQQAVKQHYQALLDEEKKKRKP